MKSTKGTDPDAARQRYFQLPLTMAATTAEARLGFLRFAFNALVIDRWLRPVRGAGPSGIFPLRPSG